MASGIHHVSCFAGDDSVPTFLRDVLGLEVFDRFAAPPEVTASMFRWPEKNPGAEGARFGHGPNGLVEVMTIPEELKDKVTPGLAFVTFTVKDLQASLEHCRRLGFEVGPVGKFDPSEAIGLSAAIVSVGGVPFELVQYSPR